MHPTKHQISLLWSHNFKLWDGSRQWQIESLHKEGISIVMDETNTVPNSITFEDIGRGFKVIRKPLSDLTVADGDGKSAMNKIKNEFYKIDWGFIELPFDVSIFLDSNSGVDFGLSLSEMTEVIEKLHSLGFFPSLADDCCVDFNSL